MYGKTQFNIWYKLEGVCMCVLVGKSDVLSINNVYIHIQYNIKRERDSRKFGKLKLVYMESWVGCCVHHPLTDRQLYTISESEFFNRHRMTVTDTDTDIHLYGLRVTRLDDDYSPLMPIDFRCQGWVTTVFHAILQRPMRTAWQVQPFVGIEKKPQRIWFFFSAVNIGLCLKI